MQGQKKLLESLDGLYGGGWGSVVDPWEPFREQWFGGGAVGTTADDVVPFSQPYDRAHGRQWPLWWNTQQLARLRQASRIVSRTNCYARGLVRNLTNYTIGKGVTFNAVLTEAADLDENKPGVQGNDTAESIRQKLQAFLNSFGKRNKWWRRQREIYRRVIRDGEAFVRLHFNPDGTTDLRFLDPAQIQDPQEGNLPAKGWSFGIQHQMTPWEDVETIVAYHIVFKDPAVEDPKSGWIGETIPANEIVHVLPPDEDSDVKRGTPEIAYETINAFTRASRLQKHISITSAVRAATAEIWEHSVGSKEEIQDFSDALATLQQSNPLTGKTENIEDTAPGTVRRVPEGQKLAQLPSAMGQGTEEHLSAAQGDLRQAATAFTAPEFMVSAQQTDASYATSLVSSAPIVKEGEVAQQYFEELFTDILWRAVKHAVDKHVLTDAVLTLCDIQAEAPAVIHQDKLAQAQVDQIYAMLQVKSRQTIQMEQGLDGEIEQANMEEWAERFSPGNGLQLPAEGET